MNRKYLKEMPVIGPTGVTLMLLWRQFRDWTHDTRAYFRDKKHLVQNKYLKGSETGKRCFILATGPSIKTQDLSSLAGELCISVSNFFVHPDFSTINPRFHIFAPSHDPIPDSQIVTWFQDAEKHFKEGQKVFVALHDRALVVTHNIFTKQKVYYYQIDYRHKREIKEIDFSKRIPEIQTVGHLALYLALYIGGQNIYLLGYDHDWLLNLGKSSHFYEEKQSALVREGYNEMVNRNMENEFRNHLTLWKLYKNIKHFAEKKHVTIQNATPTSLLDVFPFVELSTVTKKSNDETL